MSNDQCSRIVGAHIPLRHSSVCLEDEAGTNVSVVTSVGIVDFVRKMLWVIVGIKASFVVKQLCFCCFFSCCCFNLKKKRCKSCKLLAPLLVIMTSAFKRKALCGG